MINDNDGLSGKGKCPTHGPYIWKYVNGVCITEHLRKEPNTTQFLSPSQAPTYRKRPLRNPEQSLTKMLGGSF